MFSTRTRLVLGTLVVLSLVVLFAMEFSGWHQLEAVTLDDQEVKNWNAELGFHDSTSLLRQPFDSVADGLLGDRKVAKVDIDFDLPNTLHLQTNRFEPVAFAVDRRNGRMYGLNPAGRRVPLRKDNAEWECPVFTGVAVGGLFELCSDPRVAVVLSQLSRLEDDNRTLYRQVEEVDFTGDNYVLVTISGLPYQLKANAESLHQQLGNFIRFLEDYHPDVTGARQFDLRYENMIVQSNERGSRGR